MDNWSEWKPLPSPENCKNIDGPEGPGVYQIKNAKTTQLIQFGISKKCRNRMRSLFPKPYGTGTRKNEFKRSYILANWNDLVYRTIATKTREEARLIEKMLMSNNNQLFNT